MQTQFDAFLIIIRTFFPSKGPDVEDKFHKKVEMIPWTTTNSLLISDQFLAKKYVNTQKLAKIQRDEADKIIFQSPFAH